ncbi:NAD(P)H-dependent FMN reductase [Kribbella steppae]|uniref:NAD(P)H-dependent FMN reductase n=2 Tax=Kribbella steppae TaxID=2512223 RepID=A0A4R2H2T4_9ACTN|nr:NAD(P)H-dependent FMN reductase [Kribbella steppae]
MVIASTRPGRLGPAVGDWFVRATAELGVDLDVADLAEVNLPFLDEPEHPSTGIYQHEHTRVWSRRVADADAFVFVTSEYNFAMPATLKNAFDYLHAEWAWKPCLFVGYGNTSAGTRGVQMARGVAGSLRMLSIGGDIFLRIADDMRDGVVVDSERLNGRAAAALRELCRVADVLRPLYRDGISVAPAVRADAAEVAPALPADVAELLVLQRCCWVDEAVANARLDLPALLESEGEVRESLRTWSTWCVRSGGRLVGSVRARRDGDIWEIGRLMVAPDHRRTGLGRRLLAFAEAQAPDSVEVATLFTGERSDRNILLYQKSGYALTGGTAPAGAVRLTKPLAA